MAADKQNLLLLFDRPQEPIFMEKGNDGKVFDVPSNFLTDRYRPIGIDLANRFGENAKTKIPVSNISVPNLDAAMAVNRNEGFSLFIPKHRAAATRLIDIFLGMRTLDDLQSAAIYARDRVNPYLFNYALSVAILHRPDTRDVSIPLFVETFPDKFMDSKVFAKVREEANVVTADESRLPIIIPKDYTASDLDEEHRLWYYREDIGLNLMHWHWHLVYPFFGNRNIVNKDRRGELFYYMHQQLLGRYNFERFSNFLARVKRFNNLREPIKEAYFPKLDSLVASRTWPGRTENSILRDINRELDQVKNDVTDLERWRDRIYDAIHQQSAVDQNGTRIPLDEVNGINVLGNMLESSILSPNRQVYGDLHNYGHVFISFVHDPDHKNLESFSVMGDSATACRDPVFYRWHAYIDDIFQEHKELLPPYNPQQLGYSGVQITGVSVKPDNGSMNTFQTFWQQSDINLSRGMDFVPRGNVFARFTHLQHTPFTYSIQINNTNGNKVRGTVRIFLSPKFDERGSEMLFRDQRKMMVELDRFFIEMNVGSNTIRRKSNKSNVTIPFERTFRDVDANRPMPGTTEEASFNFCGCGWPEHLLIPKGTTAGLPAILFVMVSNYTDDVVESTPVGSCNDAAAYCGVRDSLYPDRRAMGFPFDRNNRTGADRLDTFMLPNMMAIDCIIKHTDEIRPRRT